MLTKEQAEDVLQILKETRSIVCDGAENGFNVFTDGEKWAEPLFLNNAALSHGIKLLEKELANA